jgi:hypothetical protein
LFGILLQPRYSAYFEAPSTIPISNTPIPKARNPKGCVVIKPIEVAIITTPMRQRTSDAILDIIVKSPIRFSLLWTVWTYPFAPEIGVEIS